MTKTSLLSILLAVTLFACSNSEQEELVARQKRVEEREQRETAERQAREAAATPTPAESAPEEDQTPAEPESPPEPEYQEVTVYYFTSSTERTPIKCYNRVQNEDNLAIEGCGERFDNCENGNTYSCQVSVKYFTKTEKQLVKQEN